MDKSTLYIAYGSNLHRGQMAQRCPGAEVLGIGSIKGYRLAFKTLGVSAFATIEPLEGESVPVAVWRITGHHELALDRYEGFPLHYGKEAAKVSMGGSDVEGMVYVMNPQAVPGLPSRGYFECVLAGYRSFGLEEEKLMEAWGRALEASGEGRGALRHFRLEKGLTQSRLAEEAGLPVKSLQKYESGERSLGRAQGGTVLRLAQVLGVSPYLLAGQGQDPGTER